MSSTRLLVLGVVRIFQPVHGYLVRRELLSWNVDHWAHLNPGSIYHALRTGGVVIGIAVVALLGAAFSSLSYAAALTLKSEDALAPLLNGLAIPVLLLSGILLPMSLAPTWLRGVSDVNPLKWVVDGLRATFRGDIVGAATGWGLLATVGLVIAGVAIGTRTFRRESA